MRGTWPGAPFYPCVRGPGVPVARKIMNWLVGCRHRELSRAFTSNGETYKVCLKCGAHLKYSWQTMKLVGDEKPTRSKPLRESPESRHK